jgi:hypothetical protein
MVQELLGVIMEENLSTGQHHLFIWAIYCDSTSKLLGGWGRKEPHHLWWSRSHILYSFGSDLMFNLERL